MEVLKTLVSPEHDDCGDVAEEAEAADQGDADTLEEELDPGHELGVPARRGAVRVSRQVHVCCPELQTKGPDDHAKLYNHGEGSVGMVMIFESVSQFHVLRF